MRFLPLPGPRAGVPGLPARPPAQNDGMDLKRPLVLLALVGSLVACGDNTDAGRGTTESGTAEDSADCADTEDSPGTRDDTGENSDGADGEAGTGDQGETSGG